MNQASPDQQIKVKIPIHLRLTHEDWKETFKALTRAELGVLYAIRTLDPFGDRELDIDCAAWGTDLGLHRTSVSRALESLSHKKLIDLEIVKARVKQKVSNKKLTLLAKAENESNQEQKEENEICAPTHRAVHPRTELCTHAQSCAPTHATEPGTLTTSGFQDSSYSSYSLNTFNTPPIAPQAEKGEEKKLKEEKNSQERKRSVQISLATFRVMMDHIATAIGALLGNLPAATPLEQKLSSTNMQTDEHFVDAKTLRRLSQITGLTVESLRTNIGLQKALRDFPSEIEGCLDYLQVECKTFKPGIGFIVVALREGRKLNNAGGAAFGEWVREGEQRGLVASTMAEGDDILIIFRRDRTIFDSPKFYSEIKGRSWNEIAL